MPVRGTVRGFCADYQEEVPGLTAPFVRALRRIPATTLTKLKRGLKQCQAFPKHIYLRRGKRRRKKRKKKKTRIKKKNRKTLDVCVWFNFEVDVS